MNTFNKKSLYAAIAGLGALGAVGAAQAVNVNPDGLGQVLIYPYYTTRADAARRTSYNSLLSVVNSTASAKAVKVRFLEGKNTREVLDFNLFLSPNDVWTAAIVPSGAGGARSRHDDKSCTLPAIPAAGKAFVNYAYSARRRAAPRSTARRKATSRSSRWRRMLDTSTTAANVTHVNGVPPGCAAETDALASPKRHFPAGGLFGGMTLINVDSGPIHGGRRRARQLTRDTPIYANSGSTLPDLHASQPAGEHGHQRWHGVYQSTWAAGQCRPGQRGADARQRDERVRARYGHAIRAPTGSSRCRPSASTSRTARARRPSCSSATSTRPMAPATTFR